MRYCEMETQGRLALPCDERAMFKIENHWYCQIHAAAVEEAQSRWSGINWFSLTEKDPEKKPDLNDADGRFWDDEEA